MLIQQKFIQNIHAHITTVVPGASIVIGVKNISRFPGALSRMGFSNTSLVGSTILPSAAFGRFSRFNALGKNLVRKDLPMETVYRMAEWHWKEWRGRGETEEMTGFVDVPYQRYPREFISPPSVELTLCANRNNETMIVAPAKEFVPENFNWIVHTINLFLELFGECEIFTEDLDEIFKAPIRRLNWQILPPGKYPWEQMREHLQPVIRQAREGNRPVVENRLETVNGYNPEFVAIGQGGFRGYVIFAFPAKNTFVLENPFTNNATYIFAERWEELSCLTKAQILDANLHKDRIIHRKDWHSRISSLLD